MKTYATVDHGNTGACQENDLPDPAKPLPGMWPGALVDRLRGAQPDKIAIESVQSSWKYGELDRITARLEAFIVRSAPSGKGVVALYANREPSLVFALIGIIRSGFSFLILDPAYPPHRISQCLSLAQPVILINLSAGPLPNELSLALSKAGCQVMLHWSDLWGDLVATQPAAKIETRRQVPVAQPDDLLYVAFTSGSTGFPKAVLGTHGPVMHFLDWQQQRFNLTSGERISVLGGMGHDPLLRDIFLPLWLGATVCIPPQDCFQVPHRLFEWMRTAAVTVAHLTPSLGSLLLAGDRQRIEKLNSLRFVFFGGEMLKYPLVRKLKESAPQATVVNCYGTTETPQVMGYHVIADDEIVAAAPTVPVGKGIDGVQLLVLDNDDRLCTSSQEGQIVVRSPYLAREVRGEDGQAINVFKANPYGSSPGDRVYPTGDFGYYRSDGSVVCTGRKDRQIKIRGHRLQLEEIDQALASVPGILQYHIDVETSSVEPLIVLYVVFAKSQETNSQKLAELLKGKLAPFLLPGKIVAVDAMPLTPNGKVDQERLRLMKASGPANVNSPAIPNLTPTEAELLRIFTEHTADVVTTLDDEITMAILDSLRAINVCCAIEVAFGVTLSVQDIFDCRTIRGIATRLQPAVATTAVPIPSKENGIAEFPVASPNLTPRLFPENERFLSGIKNRFLQLVARVAPDAWRIKLHRLRGVEIGKHVSIGYDTIVETSYPWLVRVGDHVNIGMRVTIIGHFRGMANRAKGNCSVNIQDYAFIGPGCLILPNVTIGKGAVVSAGSVVNTNIPPFVLAHGNPAKPIAQCGVSLSGKTTYDEFLRHLKPIPEAGPDKKVG